MAEYFITKQDDCVICGGDGKEKRKSLTLGGLGFTQCQACDGTGRMDTFVSLLEALNAARITEVNCDCGLLHWGKVEGDEGQLLEWTCPTEGLKRSPNA